MRNIITLFIFLLYSVFCFSQSVLPKETSNTKLQKLSLESYNKALWFQDMPQYNEDSTAYNFRNAEDLLNYNKSLNYPQLAKIYLARCNYINRIYDYHKMDSIAGLGYKFLKKVDPNQRNIEFEYTYLFNWAKINLELGKTEKALELFNTALQMVQNNKDAYLEAIISRDKGIFYAKYGLKEQRNLALDYLQKSLNYFKKQDPVKSAKSLYLIEKGIIACLTKSSNYSSDSVYFHYAKMREALGYIKNPNIHAIYLCTFGRELITTPKPGLKNISKEQYFLGKKNILKALSLLQKYNIKNTTIEPYCYGLLADLDLKDEKFNSAILNYQKARTGYLNANSRYAAGDILGYISRAYEKNGDLKNALIIFSQYYDESVKYERETNQRSLRENELQINVLKQDKELEKKQNQVFIYAVVLGIILIILGLVFWNFRNKQKTNKKLEIINNDLADKNNLLDKRNADNELLMREIHHRVKNNLEIVSGLLALQSAQITDLDTKEAIIEGQNRVNSIGIVHQKLYQGTQLGAIEMKDYLLNLSESILDSFGVEDRITLSLEMDKLDLDIDTAIPLGLIINELFTNALKYAFPNHENGTITIQLEKQPNHNLYLNFTDNGVGKSGEIKGTGFGSQLINLLTRQLNGKMEETHQNGTAISFNFKLKG